MKFLRRILIGFFLFLPIILFSQSIWEDTYILYGKNYNLNLYSFNKGKVIKTLTMDEKIDAIEDLSENYFYVKCENNSYLVNKNDFSILKIDYPYIAYGYGNYYVYDTTDIYLFFPDKVISKPLIKNIQIDSLYLENGPIVLWGKDKAYFYVNRVLDSVNIPNIERISIIKDNPRAIIMDEKGAVSLWSIYPVSRIFSFPGIYKGFYANKDRYVLLYKDNTISLWNRRSFLHLRDTEYDDTISFIKKVNDKVFVGGKKGIFNIDDTLLVKRIYPMPNPIDIKEGPDNLIFILLPDSLISIDIATDSMVALPIDSTYRWAVSKERLDIKIKRKKADLYPTATLTKEEKTEYIKGYSLQIAATSSLNGADRIINKIKKGGVPVYKSVFVNDKGQTQYRIRIGLYKDRNTADIFKKYIMQKYPDIVSSTWYMEDSIKSTETSLSSNKYFYVITVNEIYILSYQDMFFNLDFGYKTDNDIVPGSVELKNNEIKCLLSNGDKIKLYKETGEWKIEKISLKDSIN